VALARALVTRPSVLLDEPRSNLDTILRVRILDAPQFRPGDPVDLAYVGGPTVGYPRAAERRARRPDAHAEGLGKVQHQ
jgi:hypothetical protein